MQQRAGRRDEPEVWVSGGAELARYRLRKRRFNARRHAPWRIGFAALLLAGFGLTSAILAAAGGGIWAFERYGGYGPGMGDAAALIARLPQGGSRIYDRHGELLYEYRTHNVRRYVPLSEISPWMLKATVATEDSTFWTNDGINLNGLARAGIENFTPFADSGWFRGSGGSSITQQLAKNVYIAPGERLRRSIDRKIREGLFAIELTKRYSKEQILEWYLNSISYGGQYVGVQAAAEGYFGKSASELTIGEAALLAGIPQRPAAYEPVTNPAAAQARQRDVLDLMVRHGVATPADIASAHATAIEARRPESPVQAPHFVFGPVAREIEARFGPEALVQGGLEIKTSLDMGLQREAHKILETWITKYETVSGGHNGAVYALDARDASVLVYIGSRDYFRDDIAGRNDNVQGLNSPGSTLKPFTYMNAFMHGWSPGTGVLDVPIKLKDGRTGEDFVPRDPTQHYQGVLTAAQALGNSLNIPAIQAIQFAGVNDTVRLLRKVGITTLDPSENAYGPALTLGGVDVSLQDLVYAYSVLAGQGRMLGAPSATHREPPDRQLDPSVILRVADSAGKVLYEYERPSEQQVVPPSYAYLVTSVLSDGKNQCLTWGVCGALQLPGRPSAQKTGTSEPFENTKTLIGDTWAVGYTPQIVAGTWFGNSDNSPMGNIFSTTVSWQIWKDFMVMAHDRLVLPPEPFVRPPTVVERQVCAGSGKLVTPACPGYGRYTSLFAAEAFDGPQPIALFDDWWQRTPGGVRLVLPPDLQRWSDVGSWVARIGGPALVTQLSGTPTPGTTPGGSTTPPGTGLPVAARSAPTTTSVSLSTPGSGSVARGPVAISGVAGAPNLAQVVVEVSTPTGGWATVGVVAGESANGVPMTWAVWNPTGVPEGQYAIRVTARDRSGATAVALAAVTVQR